MYQVLIVDDDVEMLQYLSNLVDWSEFGMQLVGQECNGQKAKELLEEKAVDILVTDIEMPKTSGLELIRYARGINKDIVSIILTCHESFAYAKEAIELGVSCYLTKDLLEKESFLNALLNACKILKEMDAKKNAGSIVQRKIEKADLVLIERRLQDFLKYNTGSSQDFHTLAEKLMLNEERTRVVLFKLMDWDVCQKTSVIQEKNLLLFAIQNIIQEKTQNWNVSYPFSYAGEYLIQFVYDERDEQTIDECFRMIERRVFRYYGIHIAVLSFKISKEYNCLSRLIARANEEIKKYLYLGRDGLGYQLNMNQKYSMIDIKDYPIYGMLWNSSQEELEEENNRNFENFYMYHADYDTLLKYYEQLISTITVVLYKKGLVERYNERTADTWYGFRILTQDVIQWMFQLLQNRKSERREIFLVKQYVERNLEKKISCSSMAKMVNLSTSYFSKLFKEETGESFSDYLIRVRIEKAEMLLTGTNMSVEEITEKIGLADIHYFHRLYKQKTGKTPKETKRELL